MATLVLQSVGTALGGPVGGAIGSLLGQSIDQQIFGSKGPRVGGLKVQGASYGSPIPRVYGTMRIAGNVVWATDLKSNSSAASKNQPGASYSVSLAVALSSRRASQVKRIWADGKLLRGAAGDFKVGCTYRFYPGDEQQGIDPLIASIETISSTPAYRGIALAVFEDLQLAEFGNRIPFLTFEIEADSAPPQLGAILSDASGAEIECSDADTVIGYAAYGDNIQSAIKPIVDSFGIQLFDDGGRIRSPTPSWMEAADIELGCGADSQQQPKIERSQTAARSLPSQLTLSYYDPARDYQTAQSRASMPATLANAVTSELPAVLDASSSKALAESALARRWAERDTLRLRLPPSYLTLEPGMLLKPPGETAFWMVSSVAIDSMAVVADLHSRFASVDPVAADPGRVLSAPDEIAQPTAAAILELPDIDGSAAGAPIIAVAASNSSSEWAPVRIELNIGGVPEFNQTAASATVLGTAMTILPDGQSALIDENGSVDVQFVNADQWLESRDGDALVNGENLAAIGDELIQFGQVTALGAGKFRVSRLLRGRRGTEWAMASHQTAETFALIDPATLQRIPVDPSLVGTEITLTPLGLADPDAAPVSHTVSGIALRPPSPVHLTARFEQDGSLSCCWCRRSQMGWLWMDDVDSPLGCSSELYRVQLQGSLSSITVDTPTPQVIFAADQVAVVGGQLTVSVIQVGDLAVSMPASIPLTV